MQILERESIRLSRVRTLHIDDLNDLFRNTRQGAFAAGFEQDPIIGIEELLHERDDVALLQHRFAAGDLDHSAAWTEAGNLSQNLIDGHLATAVKAELAVAPGAAQVASGQTDEDAGQASVGRFSLERFVDFGDLHGSGAIGSLNH